MLFINKLFNVNLLSVILVTLVFEHFVLNMPININIMIRHSINTLLNFLHINKYLYIDIYINWVKKSFSANKSIVGTVANIILLGKENLSELYIPKLIRIKTKYSPDFPSQP